MKNINKQDLSLLIMRSVLGLTVAAHGAQKLFGWFGGYGFNGTMGYFTQTIGLPAFVALGIILAESLGMIALVLGLFSRFFSTLLIAIMIGAIVTVHGQFGFFMNWDGNYAGEGFEFHLLVIAMATVITMHGAGAYSLDGFLSSKRTVQQDSYAK